MNDRDAAEGWMAYAFVGFCIVGLVLMGLGQWWHYDELLGSPLPPAFYGVPP